MFMKKLKSLIISDAGNTIILVLFTALSCIIIISITLYITFNQFQYSQMYKKSFNIDYIALSGAEKAICSINNDIRINFSSILNDIISEILLDISNNDTKSLEYVNGFKIKNEILKSKIETKIFDILDYKFSYNIEVEDSGYKVEVELTKSNGDYIITSKAKNINTNVVCKAIGTIKLENNIEFDNIIFEQYDWKSDSKPELLSNALTTNALELKDNATLNTDSTANSNIFNDTSKLNEIISKNIIILKDNEQQQIDIQLSYNEPSIIIDARDNGKIIFTANDEFNGIIYSVGQIEFANDITINGIVICDSIIIDEGVNINIAYNPDSILSLETDDYNLKRNIYDFLKLTNYKSTNLTDILGYLKLKVSSPVNTIINNINDINFKFINLRIADI